VKFYGCYCFFFGTRTKLKPSCFCTHKFHTSKLFLLTQILSSLNVLLCSRKKSFVNFFIYVSSGPKEGELERHDEINLTTCFVIPSSPIMHLIPYDDDTSWSHPIWWTLWITLISWHVSIKFLRGFASYYLFILWNAILTILQVIVLSFHKQLSYKYIKLGHILWFWQFCKWLFCHFINNLVINK
jgi:hypothetical protein